jgi:IS30 family transposase
MDFFDSIFQKLYFPKTLDFNPITPEELAQVVGKLNNWEQKHLDFLSPRQVF